PRPRGSPSGAYHPNEPEPVFRGSPGSESGAAGSILRQMRAGRRRRRPVAISRRRAGLAIALCGAALVFALAAGAQLLRDGEARDPAVALVSHVGARTVDTADAAVPPAAGLHPVGVNTFLEQEVESASRRRALAMVHDTGFGAIRQQFPWA